MSNQDQQMVCAKLHKDVVKVLDSLVPKPYMSRAEFVVTAIREKFERDGIEY